MNKLLDLEKHISITASNQVSKIIKPLEDAFGIQYFRYLKLYKDGERIVFTNNPDAIRYKYEQGNCESMWFDGACPEFLKKGWYYWNVNHALDARESEIQTECDLNKLLGTYHGITLVQASKNCYEIFSFDTVTPDIYSIDKNLLSRFTFYFRQEARKLIYHAEEEKIILPFMKDLSHIDLAEKQEAVLKFLSNIKVNRYYLGERYKNTYLTTKEAACVHGIIQGKTAEEIALLENCQPTTVHRHIENIKSKLGCHKQAEIVKAVLEAEIFNF